MQPDVAVNLMTASGMSETQAEWTRAARRNYLDAADRYGKSRNIEIIRMGDDAVLDETPERPGLPMPVENQRLVDAKRLALENPMAVANIVKSWVNGEAPA